MHQKTLLSYTKSGTIKPQGCSINPEAKQMLVYRPEKSKTLSIICKIVAKIKEAHNFSENTDPNKPVTDQPIKNLIIFVYFHTLLHSIQFQSPLFSSTLYSDPGNQFYSSFFFSLYWRSENCCNLLRMMTCKLTINKPLTAYRS